MIPWLRANKFRSHSISFSLMMLASVGLYLFQAANPIVWGLLAVFVAGNLIAMFVK